MKYIIPLLFILTFVSCTSSSSTKAVSSNFLVNIFDNGVKVGQIIEQGQNYVVYNNHGQEVLFLRRMTREVYPPTFTLNGEVETRLLHYFEFIFPVYKQKAELSITDIRARDNISFLTNRKKRIHYLSEFIATTKLLSFAGSNPEKVKQFTFKYGVPYSRIAPF